MGTTFTAGQLAQLGNNLNIAVATALPKVAAKFEPKALLKALEGKGQMLADKLEPVLEQIFNGLFMLGTSGTTVITLAERHNPDTFYRTRSGLYVYDGFRNLVVAKATPTEAGTAFKVEHALLTRDMADKEIEEALPAKHLFDETTVSAVIAGMIAEQPNGKEGKLLNNGYANLFYTSSCVVIVRWVADGRGWGVYAWERGGRRWRAGRQVFSPAN